MSILFAILQIVLAIIAVYMVYVAACWILFTDRLVVDDEMLASYSSKSLIFDGYIDMANTSGVQFNTVNQKFDSYIFMPVSVNRKGGAQFSYSFWVYIDDLDQVLESVNNPSKEYTLFLRGDNKTYDVRGSSIGRIECPRISFKSTSTIQDPSLPLYGDTGTAGRPQLCISYNYMNLKDTANVPSPVPTQFYVRTFRNEDNTSRHNLLSLMPKKWTLLTIVMMDNMPLQDFENGIIIKVYVNDLLYDTDTKPSCLFKQNRGNMFIAPDGQAGGKMKMGKLTYYNYALTEEEIRKAYEDGPPTKPYVPNIKTESHKLRLTEYNKMDIYNV